MFRRVTFVVLSLVAVAPQIAFAQDAVARKTLTGYLAPFLECVNGERESFAISVMVELTDDDDKHEISAKLAVFDSQSFDLEIRHTDYWLQLYRRSNRTAMVLPIHKTAFVGEGAVGGQDRLQPSGIGSRIISPASLVGTYLPIINLANADAIGKLLPLQQESDGRFVLPDIGWITFGKDCSATLSTDSIQVQIEVSDNVVVSDMDAQLAPAEVHRLDRHELEQTIVRGVRRGLEVALPSPLLTLPIQQQREVSGGRLQWIDGGRVAILSGTPEQIGRAHGELLTNESLRCLDSVIHMFGLARTIQSGRWFKDDLRSAYQQLQPHIPNDHQEETDALADALAWDRETLRIVNVFPELFHCSGFAVFGSATKDGKLYHGRVLDYMTTIGLQDSATTFIVAADGKIPFATVGYAGFIGSVSGMNARGVSLGEMGGRGEGQWDGVPMATLMRRAMEECSTLAEVKRLWTDSPRTCEYYYVFADGKTNEAVGVAATPDKIEFVDPGQTHPLLGEGIKDAVVLSADERLKILRSRVQDRHGAIDAESAMWLMSRPVAMQSNLHNVLFVPQDRVMYVANADHQSPAAERPYARIDLGELLQSIPGGRIR